MSGNFKFVMDYNDTEDEIEWERERLQSNRKKHRRRKRSKITDTDDVPVMKHVITDPAAFIDGVFTSTAFDEKLAAAGLSDSLCAVQLVRVRVGMAGEMASPEDIEIVDKVIAEVSERLNTLRALAVRVDVLELPDAFDLTSVLDGSVAPASLLTDICVVVVASEEVDVTWRTKLAAHAVCALDDETIELLKQDLAVAESQQLAPVFGLSETHRLAWLVGVDEFVVCLAKLDATLSDHGLTAPFSRRLQCVRNKLAGGRQKLGMAVNKWLTNVTDVGELLREYNLDMDIGTEKAEIARCIIAIEATRVVAEEHINQLVCDEIERRATVNSVLQAYHHPELYDSIVATCWHLPAAELSDFVLRSIARHRADMFRAIAHDDDVVVRSWDNREIKSNIIATFCERLADSGSLCSDGRSPENVINEAVAVARAEIEQWKAGIEQEQAMCVARKAELDRLLVSRGYVFQKEEEKSVGSRKMLCDTLYADVDKLENRGIDLAPDCLWRAEMSNGPNSCAPLRLPPRLAGVDVVALAQVVNDTSAPVRLPVRIEVQAARRSALLAALRSRGVPENRIRPVARGSDGALFWFLKCDRWPRSRASTSSLVGDVVESMRGDVFAALPQLAISCICHFTLLTDLANLCVASDSFALGAAVWIHEERQWSFEHQHESISMLSAITLATLFAAVAAHQDGAGQCDVPADISAANAIKGMASRGRDGTNTVTVTPATAAPGGKVQIKVDATEFIGVLGAVYAADAKVGTHTPPTGGKACSGDANAITHSDVLAAGTKTLSWDYTLPATASGTLEVRVVTLNGVSGGGAAQKFALGKATITVSGSGGSGTTVAGGSDTAAATTTAKADGSTTTKKADSPSAASLVSVASAAVAAAVVFLF